MSEVSKYELLIRESHLDTFGHVNNATYLVLYEEARWEVISNKGYDLKYIQKSKQGPVLLDVTVKFMRELKLREKIIITTEMVEQKGKIGKLKQTMVKEDGTVASEAIFTIALFDTHERKIIEPTDAWKKAIGLIES